MFLESLEPKENEKVLKKNIFSKFCGVSAPLKPLFLGFGGFLGGTETPQNLEKIFFQNFIIFFGL